MKVKWSPFACGVLACVLWANAEGQTTKTNLVPPEARPAFEAGVAAFKERQWNLAVERLTQALEDSPWRCGSPCSPIVLNLGLAHNAAGHHVASIPWLEAYVAVAPGATDTASVRQEIAKIKSATRETMNKIFDAALNAAKRIPERKLKQELLLKLVEWEAFSGEIDNAQKTESEAAQLWDSIYPPEEAGDINAYLESLTWSSYTEYLALAGEFENAHLVSARVREPKQSFDTVYAIAIAEALFGHFPESRKTIAEAEAKMQTLEWDYKNFYSSAGFRESNARDWPRIDVETKLKLANAYEYSGDLDKRRSLDSTVWHLIDERSLRKYFDDKMNEVLWGYFEDSSLRVHHALDYFHGSFPFEPIDDWTRAGKRIVRQLANKDVKSGLSEAAEKNTPYEMSIALGQLALSYGKALAEIQGTEQLLATDPFKHPSKAGR
jgi:hypothetical protein